MCCALSARITARSGSGVGFASSAAGAETLALDRCADGTFLWPLCVDCSRRIATLRPSDELNNLLKLARPELSDNLVDATLMKQQDTCYHRLAHTFSDGPSRGSRIERA